MRGPRSILALLLLVSLALPLAQPQVPRVPQVPEWVPEAVVGGAIEPLFPVSGATALAFGPGVDGHDLYITTLLGEVLRVSLVWTAAGPVVNGFEAHASGFSQPLGIAFEGDVAYVADSHANPATGRTDGRITRIDADGTSSVVVDGLPNGRHNTNHLRFGPDGRLYIANGNPNDHGTDADEDVFPYSGAILSIDTASVTPSSPAALEWTDGGVPIPPGLIAGHAANADFASDVQVLAHGFRNVFGVAFSPGGRAYTAMNGADDPASQDALFSITPGADYGFPFCYNQGNPGAFGGTIGVVANPSYPSHDCSSTPRATALLGWHTCTTGLDFPTTGPFAFPGSLHDDVFVAECTALFPDKVVERNAAQPSTHNSAHKVVRIPTNAAGEATRVQDFVTGLAAPTDVHFGPDGAMYIADVEMVYRVTVAGDADLDAPAPTPEDLTPVLPADVGPLPPVPSVAIQAGGFSFVPPVVAVPAGTTVQWDGVLIGHTVDTADSLQEAQAAAGNDPDNSDADPDTFSEPLPQGASVMHTFDVPGTYYYFCQPHAGAGMVGIVQVLDGTVPAAAWAFDPAAFGDDPLGAGGLFGAGL